MRTQTLSTHRLMKSAAALVAVSAIAFGLSVPSLSRAQGSPAGSGSSMEQPMGPGGPGRHRPTGEMGGSGLMALMSPRASARLMDTLKLDATQRTAIQAIQSRMRTQMEAQRAEDTAKGLQGGPGAIQRQMMTALTQPTIDTAAIERLRQDSLARMQQRSQQHVQFLTEMAQVLTPAQRTQLAGLMQARWDRHDAQMRKARPAPPPPAPAQ